MNAKLALLHFGLVAVAVLSAGCVSGGRPEQQSMAWIRENIKPGVTTKNEVLAIYGPPAVREKNNHPTVGLNFDRRDETWTYKWGKTVVDRIDFNFETRIVVNETKAARLTIVFSGDIVHEWIGLPEAYRFRRSQPSLDRPW